MFENREYVVPLISRTSELVRSLYFYSLTTVDELELRDPDLASYARPLIGFFAERTQAVFLLVDGGYLWDAEMLTRPMAEATIRLLYCCYCNPHERSQHISEFWNDLVSLGLLKHSERAKTVLEIANGQAEWERSMRPLLLNPEEETEIRNKWSSAQRGALERRWSISEMLKSIDRYAEGMGRDYATRVALHSYGNSSHFLHADGLALALTADRLNRQEAERERLSTAHATRILSDCVWYLRAAIEALRSVQGNGGKITGIDDELHDLEHQFKHAEQEFYAKI